MDEDREGSSERELAIDQAIATYLRALESGSAPSRETFLAAHAEMAPELESFLNDHDLTRQWTKPILGCLEGARPLLPDLLSTGYGSGQTIPLSGAGGESPTKLPLESPAHEFLGSYGFGEIGGFKICGVIGRGAFGTVFKAWDEQLSRVVAIKVPRPDCTLGPEDRERFLRDGRNAASLSHPAIPRVFAADCIGEIPFLVREYIPGQSLAEAMRSRPFSLEESIGILIAIADALQYAHERRLFHRDVKPSNILLNHEGRPYLTDFGLSLHMDEATITETGQVLGTACFMSPEQARGQAHGVDGRTDVYSLGIILYQMLTHELPFRGNTRSVLEQVLRSEPRAPRSYDNALPRDLEIICLRAIAKEPRERYPSARQLADDLRSYLDHKPIWARPAGPIERTGRWCRRNPVLAVAGSSAAALLLITTGLAVAWAVHAGILQALARRALLESESRRAENHLDRGLMEAERGEIGLGLLWMARALETAPASAEELAGPIRLNLASWGSHVFALKECAPAPPSPIFAFDADGESAWSVEKLPTAVRRWQIATGKFVGPALEHSSPVTALSLEFQSKQIVTGCKDGFIRVWNTSTSRVEREFLGNGEVLAAALSSNGQTLLTARLVPKQFPERTVIQAWETRSGKALGKPNDQLGRINTLAVSSDGKIALIARKGSKTIERWEIDSGQLQARILPHQGTINAVALSPDGRMILTGGQDRTVRLWEARAGRPLTVVHQREPVWSVAFSPDGQALWTASPTDAVRCWARAASCEPLQILRHPAPIRVLQVSPTGTHIVTGSDDCQVRIWNVTPNGVVLERHLPHVSPLYSAAFSPNGECLVTSTHEEKAARLWEVNSGRLLAVLPHDGAVRMAAFSPDGRRVATASYNSAARVWDGSSGQLVFDSFHREAEHVTALAYSADGKALVTTGTDNLARIWDAATGLLLGQTEPHSSAIISVAISPDSRLIITGSWDGAARRWDAATGLPVGARFEHDYPVSAVAFSRDGHVILTASRDQTAQLWDAKTGERVGALLRHAGPVRTATFTSDGLFVLTASEDGTARLWDTRTGRALGPGFSHSEPVMGAAFGPTPEWITTAGSDWEVKIWHTLSQKEGTAPQIVLWAQVLTGMQLDAGGADQVLTAASWRTRRQQLKDACGSLDASTYAKE